jgi:hypothetical protein
MLGEILISKGMISQIISIYLNEEVFNVTEAVKFLVKNKDAIG